MPGPLKEGSSHRTKVNSIRRSLNSKNAGRSMIILYMHLNPRGMTVMGMAAPRGGVLFRLSYEIGSGIQYPDDGLLVIASELAVDDPKNGLE
jgi:hypothetical protein